jgi:serine/threonine-protein kinase
LFPSADQAQVVVASAQNQWRWCASGEVDQHVRPESGYGCKLGDVQRQGDLLTVSMALNGYQGAAACQQVLGVRENVVGATRS